MRRFSYIVALIFIFLTFLTTACTEDVAAPSGVEGPFSLYGILNPRLNIQTLLVSSVEDLLVPATGSLDAFVTSTDLETGEVHVWRDSVVTNETGQADHVFMADFKPDYGSRHRIEAVRSDGARSSVEVGLPVRVRVEEEDQGIQDVTIYVTAEEDFSLIRSEIIYGIRYYKTGTLLNDKYCREVPYKEYVFPLHSIKNMNGEWQIDFFLNQHHETMRSYYYDDTGGGYSIWNPSTEFLALMDLKFVFTVGNAAWAGPEGDFDANVLAHPGTLSNVADGFGFVGGGYNDEAAIYPSKAAVQASWYYDLLQRNGGDLCKGLNEGGG